MHRKPAAVTGAALVIAGALLAPALADEDAGARAVRHGVRHPHHRRIVLPPERHVIEVVRHAYSTQFIINGLPFVGTNACALGWVAGQPVRLISGSWHGECGVAVFYNVARRQSCALLCPD